MTGQTRKDHDLSNVEGILETIEEAGDSPDRVSVEDMLDEIGKDALPAIMLAPALIMISPASGIPGLSSFCAMIIALASLQMVLGRKSLWLPRFISNRSVSRSSVDKAVHWLSRPAHYIDSLLGRRLAMLVRKPFRQMVAVACLAISLVVPFLEFVPFSASIAGTAIAFFALGLVASDGLLVLIGMIVATGAAGFGVFLLLS
jgi:hypothetical protein